MIEKPTPASSQVDAFIARWTAREGGAERANYALFLVELCDLIGVVMDPIKHHIDACLV